MQDINLQSIWDMNDVVVDQHYQRVQPNVLDMAHQKSQSILSKIHRNTLGELAFSFVLLIAMSTFLWDVPKPVLLGFVSYSLVTIWLSFRFWVGFRQKSSQVPTQNVKASIFQYKTLLQSYKTHLWRYSFGLIPFTVFIGFFAGYQKGSDLGIDFVWTSGRAWTVLLAIAVLVGLSYILLRWYFKFFLDKKIEELEDLYQQIG